MPVRFAGVNTLLPDQDGELQWFLDKHLSLQGSRYFCQSGEQDALRIVSAMDSDAVVLTAALPNWPPRPDFRINTLYWPTGASRWANCLLLADSDQTTAIIAACGGSGNAVPKQLQIYDGDFPVTDEDGNSLLPENDFAMENGRLAMGCEMWLLRPHPVSRQTGSDPQLWLIPLVDARFFWQWKHAGAISAAEAANWEELIVYLAGRVGDADYISAIGSAYDWKPDLLEQKKTFDYANAAQLLDAAAMSVGQRVVRQFDGELQLLAPSDCGPTWDANTDAARAAFFNSWATIAGGDFEDIYGPANSPASVTVIFPQDRRVNVIEKTGISLGVTGAATGTTKTIRVPYLPDADVFLETDQDDLATAIATAFYGWRSLGLARHGDVTFAGLKPWIFSGAEDYVEISFGAQLNTDLLSQTRVVTLPTNWGITTLLSTGKVSGGSGDESSAGGICGCSHLPVGSETCLVEDDSPEVFLAVGLGRWLESLGFDAGVIDLNAIPLEFDGDCTWISDELTRNCGYGYGSG